MAQTDPNGQHEQQAQPAARRRSVQVMAALTQAYQRQGVAEFNWRKAALAHLQAQGWFVVMDMGRMPDGSEVQGVAAGNALEAYARDKVVERYRLDGRTLPTDAPDDEAARARFLAYVEEAAETIRNISLGDALQFANPN